MSERAVAFSRLAFLLVLFFFSAFSQSAAGEARFSDAYGRLPLHFEANRGQTHEDVRFLARGPGYNLYFTARDTTLVLAQPHANEKHHARSAHERLQTQAQAKSVVVRMSLVGAASKAHVTGLGEFPGKANYFIGNDPAKWRTNVPTYAKVHYRDVYPGVDLVYYGNQRQLEYDFIVAPGADPQSIKLRFEGADRLEVDAQGDLVLHTAGGTVRQHKPVIYQEIDGVRRDIAGGYVLGETRSVSFKVAAYDRSRTLVIDPVLVYSTYLGGSSFDQGNGIAVDTLGNAYVTGATASADFPTTTGAFDTSLSGSADAFVTKLDPTGSALVYSTYIGGSNFDQGTAIAVDTLGGAYVTGSTSSSNFPTTAGAFDTTFNFGGDDAFVTKLDPTGAMLVYSTYLGSSGEDMGFGIAVDSVGNAYVTGYTSFVSNFPTTTGAFDTTFNGSFDAFVTKLDATGSFLAYSTFLGGSGDDRGHGIAVDTFGNAYVTGSTSSSNFPITAGSFDTTFNGGLDAFVTKLDATGSFLAYSTYLGGISFDQGNGIAVDILGNAYVTGSTGSFNFPTTGSAFDTTYNGGGRDAFVTKLDAAGTMLAYSTYLGGVDDDEGLGIALDVLNHVYVTGVTFSTDFPTSGAFQPTPGGGSCFGGFPCSDAFVTKLAPTGSTLVYSTYLGGSGDDRGSGIAVDGLGAAYVTGSTLATDFPTTPGAFDTSFNGSGGNGDAFVAKIADIGAPTTLVLSPPADANPVATQHCVTATVQDAGGNPISGVTVRFSVTGSVTTTGSATTDASGQATFCYMGPSLVGADIITAYADTNNNAVQDGGEPSGVAAKAWVAGAPAMLTLTPPAAINTVDTQHCVVATLRDVFGNPISGVIVRFSVTGSVMTGGSATTNASGQATFCYAGPALPGADAITAYADVNGNNTQNVGEPAGAAAKAWVLPVTTPLCEIKISNGGRITALNGDKATFGGNARSSASGQTSGQQTYQDHGPAQDMTVKSINVLAIVCESFMQASIYGQATINGSGSFFYRINVKDAGEPGVGVDTYWILLQNGYDSGQQTLEGGNVQIHRTQ